MNRAIAAVCVPLLCFAAWIPTALAQSGSGSEGGAGTTHLLAIGVCPPYRTDVPVELCRNAVKAVTENFPAALGIDKANVISMVDAETTGPKVLEQLANLAQTLKAEDRLIMYLVLHGDAFYQWANYYQSNPAIADVNKDYFSQSEDVLVFWTESEPTVPALALAQKDWLTVAELVSALHRIPAQVALILDSCSSNRYFSSFHKEVRNRPKIDFVVTSSGRDQSSNFDEARTMPLFLAQLRDALNLPTVKTFGEAVAYARATTVLHAVAQCAMVTVPTNAYSTAFPSLPVPNERTHDGEVSIPLWFCAQVPNVVDYTGEMSSRALYRP